MLIPMFDSLHQAECLEDDQARTPPFAGVDWLAIGAQQDAPIAGHPSLNHESERWWVRSTVVATACSSTSSLGAPVAQATTKRLSRSWTRHPQRSPSSGPDPAPFFSARTTRTHRFPPGSDADRWPALASGPQHEPLPDTRQTLIVSYVCPVISSAARKLPRRITINSAWATSAAGVFRAYIGVPCVSPKYVLQLRQ
jgi:hypothetical protein